MVFICGCSLAMMPNFEESSLIMLCQPPRIQRVSFIDAALFEFHGTDNNPFARRNRYATLT
jgi:hypothetical protein